MGFELAITHTQLIIHDQQHRESNDWTQDHVNQGFTYREGNVAFGVPDHDGMTYVEALLVDDYPPLTDNVIRAIKVPFHASSNVIVATIMDEVETDIEQGFYSLQFRMINLDLLPVKEDYFSLYIQLLFKKIAPLPLIDDTYPYETFAILRKSDEITVDAVITTKADLV